MPSSENFKLIVGDRFEKRLQKASLKGWVILPKGRPVQLQACIEDIKGDLRKKASELCTTPAPNLIVGGHFGSLPCSYVIERGLKDGSPAKLWSNLSVKFNILKDEVYLYDFRITKIGF